MKEAIKILMGLLVLVVAIGSLEIIKKSMQAYDDFKIQNVLFYGENET